jgi:Zn-dependent protease
VARREGLPVPRITLFIFGGVAHLGREPSGPRSEFRIAVVGPLASLVLAGLFYGLSQLSSPRSDILGQTFWYLGAANFILAAFNLIPGFPLDGGRVLRAWLWHRWNDLRRATRVVTRIGRGMGTALILLGILQLLAGLLVGGLWLVFIGLFLRQAAESSYQMTALQELLRGVSVAEMMHQDPISVGEDLSLDQLVNDYFYRYRFTSFPVTHTDSLTGLVHINQVKDVPRERWSSTRVVEVMTPREKISTVTPEEEAFHAFRQMMQSGRQKIPVVRDGRLKGILTARDFLELLRIKTDLAG